jgi:predicted PurR-regulated permease PerM
VITPPDPELSRARRERWWRYALLVLATIYVGLLLLRLLIEVFGGFTQIFLILFMAWLLAFVLSPIVAWLVNRWRMPRGYAIGGVYFATLVVSAAVLFIGLSGIGSSTANLAEDYPQTRERIEDTLTGWERAVAGGGFEIDFVALYGDLETAGSRLVSSALGDVPQVTLAVMGALILVIILSLYMLADTTAIIARLKRIVPSRFSDEVDIVERTIARAFGGFLRAQVILAGIQTILTVAVILLLGLPYGFLIGAASTLAMLVPFFGPPLALIPPIAATAIFKPEWLVPVALALLIVQTVLVNYLQPRLMREALGMHPLTVLVGLVVGAQVAGLWGALFGIPVLAVGNVFFNYFVNLRTLEETPVADKEEMLEEVRRETPEATPEEVAAIAAERVEVTEQAVEDSDEAEAPVVGDRRVPEPPAAG